MSDFGLANRIDYNPAQVGGKFPIKWTAPEALRDNVCITFIIIIIIMIMNNRNILSS